MLASNNTYILPGRVSERERKERERERKEIIILKGLGDDDDLMSVPVRESILDRVLAEIPSMIIFSIDIYLFIMLVVLI